MRKIIMLTILMLPTGTQALLITEFNDRSLFNTAVGMTTLEDFGNEAVLGIPNGQLSSSSDFIGNTSFLGRTGSVTPGEIKPGAVYTTEIGANENYFNIDAGGGFTGGFLDGQEDLVLSIIFDPLISAFGFETNSFMDEFDLTINFLSGASYNTNISGITGIEMKFFGFQSDIADITSVEIDGNDFFAFAIDNVAFGGAGSSVSAPEPQITTLLILGLSGIFFMRRINRKNITNH